MIASAALTPLSIDHNAPPPARTSAPNSIATSMRRPLDAENHVVSFGIAPASFCAAARLSSRSLSRISIDISALVMTNRNTKADDARANQPTRTNLGYHERRPSDAPE